ncbi:MAG: smalltalk protein [Bacteroides sp.]|nr:smalltalk protein [Bacteroides sp.]
MSKKELWQKILHIAITILTAIATTLGTTSCIALTN